MYKKALMAMYFFSFFMSCNYEFYLMNTLIQVNIDQGIMKKIIRHTTLVILMNWAYVSLKWEDILKADNNRRRQQQQNRIVTYALLASSISLLVTLLFLSLCQNWSWVLVQLKVRSYKRSMYVCTAGLPIQISLWPSF